MSGGIWLGGEPEKKRTILMTTRASQIEPEPIRWLWKHRIALGKLTLIAGDPGLGKSMLTANLAAHVSKGMSWPADGGECPLGDVLFVSAEDDPADTIRPRLDAAGADPERVHIVTGVQVLNRESDVQEKRLLSLRKDIDAILLAVAAMDNCRLIIIDPISAYLDGSDSHNNAEIRGMLAPLSDMASRVGAAMVCVTHLNKGGGGQALHRATGSMAFVAAARAAYLVARDKTEASKRLFLPMKNNLGPDGSGLAYSIQEQNGVPFIAWQNETIDISADEALGRVEETDHEGKLADMASEWLRDALDLGAVSSKDLKHQANLAGYSWATIRRAQADLGIKPKRVGGAGASGEWVWELPEAMRSNQMTLTEDAGLSCSTS